MRYLVAFVMAALALPLFAAGNAPAGFDHFYNLEYDKAIAIFRQEIARRPSDPAAYNHLGQAILYRALYRSGMLEESLISGEDPLLSVIRQPKLALSEQDDREFVETMQTAIGLAKERLQSDPSDKDALFLLGAAHGVRANYKFLVRKAWISALRDTTAGLRLHKRVLELDPAHVDAKLLQGVHDYVVAALPAGLRIFGAIAGIHGDRERGLRTIGEVASHGVNNRTDARILLATLYRHEKRPKAAAELLDSLHASYPRNHLLLLAGITTHLDEGDTASGRRLLPVLANLWKQADPAGAPAKLSFTEGMVEMRSGEFDLALAAFAQAGGVRSLVYTGHIYDLRGDRRSAVRAYKAAIALAPKTRCGRRSEQYLSRPYRAEEGD